jgi:hypothetical protein
VAAVRPRNRRLYASVSAGLAAVRPELLGFLTHGKFTGELRPSARLGSMISAAAAC